MYKTKTLKDQFEVVNFLNNNHITKDDIVYLQPKVYDQDTTVFILIY